MKKLFLIMLLALGGWVGGHRGALAEDPKLVELEKTPLPKLSVPEIRRKTLKSGMRLLLLEDDELPVVRGYLYIRAGSIYEPAEKLGLAELAGDALRAGGTQKTPADAFDEALADRAADVSVEIGREFGLVNFKCLKEDLPEILRLVFEMLREPAFDPQKLEIERVHILEQLRRQNDDPMEIANREFPKRIYGPDSVWARTPTAATVRAVSREDIEAFHRRFFHPERMILALSGDFREGDAVQEIEKDTAGWARASEKLPEIPPVAKQFPTGTYLIPKAIDQATVVLGHFGDKRFNPDKYALLLLNEILGADPLTSRLGKQVRSSLGLVYGITSRFGLTTDYGIFSVIAQTKAKSASQVVEKVRAQLQDLVKEDSLSEEEMEFYKNSLLSSLFAEYEPKYNFARDEARFEYFAYPPNYLQFFREKIQAVTLADVKRAAKKYLRPDALQILIVGDPKQIGPLPNAQIVDISQ